MPVVLKHEVESLDGIPEDLHSFYQPGEKGFTIPDPLRRSADAITNLYKANDNIRDENKRLQKGKVDLSPLADFGENVNDIATGIQARIAELETRLAQGEEGKLNLDKVRAELKEAHAKELALRDQKEKGLTGTIHKYLVTSQATDAIAAEAGITTLLLPHVERQVKVIQVDDEYVARVVDKDGDVRISGATGEPMTIRELVQAMKKDETFQVAFKSEEGPGGGGKKPGQAPSTKPHQGAEMTLQQKVAAGLAKRRGRAA